MGRIAHLRLPCVSCGQWTNVFVEESEATSAKVKCEHCQAVFDFSAGMMYDPVGYVPEIPAWARIGAAESGAGSEAAPEAAPEAQPEAAPVPTEVQSAGAGFAGTEDTDAEPTKAETTTAPAVSVVAVVATDATAEPAVDSAPPPAKLEPPDPLQPEPGTFAPPLPPGATPLASVAAEAAPKPSGAEPASDEPATEAAPPPAGPEPPGNLVPEPGAFVPPPPGPPSQLPAPEPPDPKAFRPPELAADSPPTPPGAMTPPGPDDLGAFVPSPPPPPSAAMRQGPGADLPPLPSEFGASAPLPPPPPPGFEQQPYGLPPHGMGYQQTQAHNPGTRKFLVWSIINTVFLFWTILPILAIVTTGKAKTAATPDEFRLRKKQIKIFNIVPYGIYALILAIALPIGLTSGSSSGGGNAAATARVEGKHDFAADGKAGTQEMAGMPIHISSNGNSYSISSFTVGKSDEGNTTITAFGSGMGKLPFRNGSMIIPIYCSFTDADGVDHELVGADMSMPEMTFKFDTSATPKKVSFYPEDNRDEKYTFDVK
ncbi:MAG: hypothetical protein FWD29_07295 [Micrococcales bacterium]|nr:hypothetical protein [Micrococcales bacterium]